MKWLWSFVMTCVLAAPALATNVLVTVGDTAEATRLVFTFEERSDWSTARSEQRLGVTLMTGELQLADNDRAAAAGSQRIKDLAPDATGSGVSITLACDCETDVYPFGSDSLVVEIRDRVMPAKVEKTASLERPPTPAEDDPMPVVSPATDSGIARNAPKPLSQVTIPKEKVASPALPWPTRSAARGLADTLGFATQNNTESQAVTLLSRELSRAASQGLIEPESEAFPSQRTAADVPNSSEIGDRSNIKIVTSLDRALSSNLGHHPPTPHGRVCISDQEVNLADWGDTSDISTIGRLRHKAYGEDGEVTSAGARDLARYYIALGFGAEAATVAQFMEDGTQRDLLLALAQIVDHGKSEIPVLDGQIFCSGQIALWAALARPIGQGGAPSNVEVILATFSALPSHHRAHLGPVLAERLREVGLEDAARNAVNAVARGGLQSNESELVTARLELGGTRPDEAREKLVEISNGTDVTAAEALLELLEDAERRGMAPNPAWVEDAPSLARATEGTEIAETLNLAGLRGRIALGQFDELRFALAEDTPGLDAPSRNALAISAVVEAARRGDDAAFLRSEVGLVKLIDIATMPRGDGFEVANRLSEIGLASRAQAYLPEKPKTVEELETFVRVYSATGQIEKAVDMLAEHDSQEAARHLGEILSQTGENATAVRAFEQGGSIDDAARSAIRAGDWTWIAERDIEGTTGALSDAARLLSTATEIASETATGDGEPGNGRLITNSQSIRRHAETLLSETNLGDETSTFTN